MSKPLLEGLVVPFLGAGVNRCGRPEGEEWGVNRYLPDGGELTKHLVENFAFPSEEAQRDLLLVSQYVACTSGTDPLYRELRRLLKAEYPTTAVHRFLADLPGLMKAKGHTPAYPDSAYPLIITTNYDDVLERAFDRVGQPFDLIYYYATQGNTKGEFLHRPPGGEPSPIRKPQKYVIKIDGRDALLLAHRPVILKIHGALDRDSPDRDSYVITEDDYIDYLTVPDLVTLLPAPLPEWLKRSHFLFLGYSLSDWNMRAFLHRIWKSKNRTNQSWGVDVRDRPLVKAIWGKRDVDIVTASLEDYIADLEEVLRSWPVAGGVTP